MINLPDNQSVFSTIQKNRDDFISYNIAHLRELIRYLSPDKFELFHTLPFLLHVNSPIFPGYVDDPDCRYGIYGFQDSGFWKLALQHFAYSEKQLLPCLAKKYHILGLYLMGSSGTLAQGDHSDLDYWVLVDDEINHTSGMDLLKHKLNLLEEWADKTYTQKVGFFILTAGQVKQNSFRKVDEESSGTIQRTILKEEFYRTFLMIAGRIPYWTVLPAGLDKSGYYEWIDRMETAGSPLSDRNYIDLGYPDAIDQNECPGALLWQVYKARHDPVKSYIKASLIIRYFFSPETTPLPCDEIKKKFSDKQLDNFIIDPYSTIFNKTLLFYRHRKDIRRLEMLRECLFLRMHGYPLVRPIEPFSPKQELLQIYLKEWAWDEEKIRHLQNYPDWPEPDKLDYEIRIISRISSLYKEIRLAETAGPKTENAELHSIQNRISAVFQSRPHKIPRCSAYIKAKAEAGKLRLLFRHDASDKKSWIVCEQESILKPSFQRNLYAGSGLSGIAGWLDVNRLHLNLSHSIQVDSRKEHVSNSQAMKFLQKAFHFLNGQGRDYEAGIPAWSKVLVAVESNPSAGNNSYEQFDIIMKNTWGEIFHHHPDLKDIENNMLKCYKLSNILYTLTQDKPSGDPQFLIVTLGAEDEEYARKTTLEFLHQLRAKQSVIPMNVAKTDQPSVAEDFEPENPFLDLL